MSHQQHREWDSPTDASPATSRTTARTTARTGGAHAAPATTSPRQALAVRAGIVVAVLAAASVGIAGYATSAPSPFTLDPPPRAAAGQQVPVGGQSGDVPREALFLLTGEPSSAPGYELFTLAERPAVDPAAGRWSGEVSAPEVDAGESSRVVAVRADPACGSSLAEMTADPQANGTFFGPLPAGCTELASAPLAGG